MADSASAAAEDPAAAVARRPAPFDRRVAGLSSVGQRLRAIRAGAAVGVTLVELSPSPGSAMRVGGEGQLLYPVASVGP